MPVVSEEYCTYMTNVLARCAHFLIISFQIFVLGPTYVPGSNLN